MRATPQGPAGSSSVLSSPVFTPQPNTQQPVRQELRRLTLSVLAASLPLLLLAVSYVITDPFKVLRTYRDFYPPNNRYVYINRDYISTELYLQQAASAQYNAFVFGNSRSWVFETKFWRPYLPAQARPYHFDASSESLFGLYHKVRFLDSLGAPIDHAFVILDHFILSRLTDRASHLYRKDPRTCGGSQVTFHREFARAYIDPAFLYAYWKRRLTGQNDPAHAGILLQKPETVLRTTNDYIRTGLDDELARDEAGYYRTHASVFYKRPAQPQTDPPIIGPDQKRRLQQIQAIFAKHHTNARFIINPLYDQRALNPQDVAWLKRCFGAENVFDFSGVNAYTSDVHNYYEESHYRSNVAQDILKQIYGTPTRGAE